VLAVTLVATAVVVTACGVPLPPELPATDAPRAPAIGDVDLLEPRDDGSEALVVALIALAARVATARDLLQPIGDGGATDDREATAAIGANAVGVLLGETDGGDAPGVLPAVEPDRAADDSDDLVTALITLAGDVGGERSRLVLELVRDPMLGDLGAWQRDPVGVVAVLRAIAGRATDGRPGTTELATELAAELDAELLELPGELTRALGYALVVAADADPLLAAHAARQAAGRLGVVLVAIELAIERLEPSS
jgi:hypothetical protein